MNQINRRCLLFVLLLTFAISARAAEPTEPKKTFQYLLGFELFSMQEGPSGYLKESYQFHGRSTGIGPHSGYITIGGTGPERPFAVTLFPQEKDQHLGVKVSVTPQNKVSDISPKEYNLDLTDLRPRTLELTRNAATKKVFLLNLMPSIKSEDLTPRPLDVQSLQLTSWNFDHSAVIIDNWRYLGELSGAPIELPCLDIAGYAKVEFALKPFPNAQPLGTLRDEEVIIKKADGAVERKIKITHVRVGLPAVELPKETYQVWVRWSPPTRTLKAEAQKMFGGDLQYFLNFSESEPSRKDALKNLATIRKHIETLKDEDVAPENPLMQVLSGLPVNFSFGRIPSAK